MSILSTPVENVNAPAAASAPDRNASTTPLHRRLESVGVCVLRLSPEGEATVLSPGRWVERRIVASSWFVAAVRRRWADLLQGGGQAVELAPGLWLAPLAPVGRLRLSPRRRRESMSAVLMLGSQLIESEALRLICDQQRLDHRATIARIDPGSLIAAPEAARLAAMCAWMHGDQTHAQHHDGDLQRLSRELADSYEELSLLYKLSANMTVHSVRGGPEAFFAEATAELQEVVGLDWLVLALTAKEPRLDKLAGGVYAAGEVACDEDQLRAAGAALLERYGEASEPVFFSDVRAAGMPGLAPLPHNLLSVTLRSAERPLAVLFGGGQSPTHEIHSADAKLCDSLANSLTIFLQNMILYADLEGMFLGTLHALTTAIDAKDSYTEGHSQRVALMGTRLAQAVGLDPRVVERVKLSGMIHDVGKIGVPEAVLTKPGKLTDDEFAMIKRHPETGARILRDIRQMNDLVPGVLHHHERWDGRGYPHGLAREDIPLFGRLLGLADAFDAMSSNRSYRSAMPHEQVLEEIARCGGTQFDPQLARAFVALDFKPYHRMIEQHQRRQTPNLAA